MSRTIRPTMSGRPGRYLRRYEGEKVWRQWQADKKHGNRQATKTALRVGKEV